MAIAPKAILSKSSYLRGVQCLKSLYLYKNHYNLREAPSVLQKALFDRGHQVGRLAHQLFPGGIDCSVEHGWQQKEAVAKTAEAIRNGHKVIYEAAFMYSGVVAILDILVLKPDGWHAFEVKSSVHLSAVFFKDAALQYYVINNTLGLRSFNLVTVDNTYRRKGMLSIEKFFKLHPITPDVRRRQAEVKRRVAEQLTMLQVGVLPSVEVGKHCFQPYPCDFMSQCWGSIGGEEILQVSGLGIEAKLALIDEGYRHLNEVPANLLPKNVAPPKVSAAEAQKLQLKLQDWLKGLTYPMVFFDIEFIQLVVPQYEGTHPYESIPFILSTHRIEYEGAPAVSALSMLQPGDHPYITMAVAFAYLCKGAQTLLAYDAAAELKTISTMADYMQETTLPLPIPAQELASTLLQTRHLVKDLRQPFVQGWIKLPELGASNSLKKVLPALCPGEGFADLEVSDGFAAARQCEIIFHQPDGLEKEEAIRKLRAYAERDTWAMVLVWKALVERVQLGQ